MEIRSYLEAHREAMPKWLADFTVDSKFDRTEFFQSRVVYYPGHGSDGHPIILFGGSHSAHCFLMVDSGLEQAQVVAELESAQSNFKGYRSFARINLEMTEVQPHRWVPHIAVSDHRIARPQIKPFGLLEILERDQILDDSHGPTRLALLFLGADGHATFDAVFCQNDGTLAPYGILLQDHGFGGNYSPFGEGGVMHQLAVKLHIKPQWLVVANNTRAWDGYEMVVDAMAEPGGMAAHLRHLFRFDQIF